MNENEIFEMEVEEVTDLVPMDEDFTAEDETEKNGLGYLIAAGAGALLTLGVTKIVSAVKKKRAAKRAAQNQPVIFDAEVEEVTDDKTENVEK